MILMVAPQTIEVIIPTLAVQEVVTAATAGVRIAAVVEDLTAAAVAAVIVVQTTVIRESFRVLFLILLLMYNRA